MNTLLITATIKPLVNVKHCDPEVRKSEYMRNLERYICNTLFDSIIFAENSGYVVDYTNLQEMAKAQGKELIVLDVSRGADTGTMSSGEARIMQQALEMCPFLSDNDDIWKVSGRVYIRNTTPILKRTKKTKGNVFLYSRKYDSFQTWFCRLNVGDLKRFFLTDAAVQRMREYCIEYVWMDIWRENLHEIKVRRFPEYPEAEGINSSGNPYTVAKWKHILRTIMLYCGRFTPKTKRRIDRCTL